MRKSFGGHYLCYRKCSGSQAVRHIPKPCTIRMEKWLASASWLQCIQNSKVNACFLILVLPVHQVFGGNKYSLLVTKNSTDYMWILFKKKMNMKTFMISLLRDLQATQCISIKTVFCRVPIQTGRDGSQVWVHHAWPTTKWQHLQKFTIVFNHK